MPSPVGHSLMGYSIYLLNSRHRGIRETLPLAFFCILIANIPDLDFLPGIIIGDIRRFHHGISHSIVFSILFGLLAASICHLRGIKDFRGVFVLSFSLYLSHIMLDYLVLSPGKGVPLFWPISWKLYMTSISIFPPLDYIGDDGVFVALFSVYNMRVIAHEALNLFPVVILSFLLRKKLQKDTLNLYG